MLSFGVVQSSMSLAAVGALLAAPPRLPPTTHVTERKKEARRRVSAVRSRLECSGNGAFACSDSGNVFDASAWQGLASLKLDDDKPQGTTSSSVLDRGVIDVDVDQLPTFVLFADGGRRREDIVGSSDARACRAKLEAKLSTFATRSDEHDRPTLTVRETKADDIKQGTSVAQESAAVERERLGADRRQTHSGVPRKGGTKIRDSSKRVDAKTNTIFEIQTRDDLLQIVTGNRKIGEQGPVVVMYHAPWCRKCAYLAPVFRRLAAAHTAVPDEGLNASARQVRFCRVDVSVWGGRPVRAATGLKREVGVPLKRFQQGAASTHRIERRTADSRHDGAGRRSALAKTPDEEQTHEVVDKDVSALHEGAPVMEGCDVCSGSGFVFCGECEGKGAVERSSADGKHKMAVACPACVGYKKLRCPSCGGKCYMC